jgi:hypothetical protein
MSREQEGWLWTLSDDDYQHAETIGEALADAADEHALRDDGDECVVTICPAYRVAVGSIAPSLAGRAIDMLSDGTLETFYAEPGDGRLERLEEDLARAFRATLERVCRDVVGDFYECLPGEVRVTMRPTAYELWVRSVEGTPALVEAVRGALS